MPGKKTYEDIINHTFNMLTVTGLAGRRSSGEQLFYCDCSCGTKNHLASKYQLVSNGLKSCGCLRKDFEDMIGQVYTRLTVIQKLHVLGYKNQALFLCQCSCGNSITIIKSKLKNKYTKSCGCLLKEINNKYKDLVGQSFGRLKVVKRLGIITARRDIFWECSCECGGTINVTTGNLTYGSVKSCGCITKELIRQFRLAKGKDPNIPMKTGKQLLRKAVRDLKLDKQVLLRDNYTCQLCNKYGGDFNIHHIVPIGEDDTKALDINNMITLCKKCHFEKAHNKNYKKINKDLQEQFTKRNSLL